QEAPFEIRRENDVVGSLDESSILLPAGLELPDRLEERGTDPVRLCQARFRETARAAVEGHTGERLNRDRNPPGEEIGKYDRQDAQDSSKRRKSHPSPACDGGQICRWQG